jgi:enediyne biosynthesis protein E4
LKVFIRGEMSVRFRFLAVSLFCLGLLSVGLLSLGALRWMRAGSSRTVHSRVTSTARDPRSNADANSTTNKNAAPFPIHFTQMMPETTGVDFRNDTGNSAERPFPAVNGNGIGVLDYDLDGNIDLYFATGNPFPRGESTPTGNRNQLYRNLGEWTHSNVSGKTGADHLGYTAGVAVGDFDSDGFPDIYLTCVGPNVLFHNRGDGTFESVGETAGINDARWGTSAAFLDYDGDGLLDIYSCNYAQWSPETNPFCGNRSRGVRIFCNPEAVAAERHLLFHNQADGTFVDSLQSAGLDGRPGRGQGVVAADVNCDGLIDLYVSNDLQPNFLFVNEGGGRFRDLTDESGAAYDQSGRSQAGMGVDAADLDGDGLPELFVTNFEQDYNTLYQNGGNLLFQDISDVAGLAAASRPWVGWGTVLADFDGDGLRDVIVTNGHTDTNLAAMDRDAPFEQPPLVWRNRGKRFELVADAGRYFAGRYSGRALSIADLDNDGDFDVVIGHQDANPALLRNDRKETVAAPIARPAVMIRLIGRDANRDAVGSLVTITSGSLTTYHQICGGRSYLSSHDLRIVAPCDGTELAKLEIRWPTGRRSEVGGLAAGSCHAIIEPAEPEQAARVVILWSSSAELKPTK